MDLFDIKDYLDQNEQSDSDDVISTPDIVTPPSIIFENVSFSYDNSEEPVLQDFNMEIMAGEKIALIGVNGAGKTTLVKLMCGFYQPCEGRVLINGVDTKYYLRDDLYALFSAVFQDIMILPYTLAENIALRPAAEVDGMRVADSLKRAGLWDYIESLPHGIDSMMLRITDKDGLLLSGGQQQKLLLARALYKDAPMLILDEPTAALDPIAESEIYEQYHELAQRKTALYISHRLASTRFCDRIIYLNNGQAEEVGTHDELMALDGGYAHMYEVQSHYYAV
jgi:ABC-type multidrug transport system fused ATPase/permease subunit